MKSPFYVLIVLLICFCIEGCKDGGCYYTCCISEDDCMASCTTGISSAEDCAIFAQTDCTEGDEGYLKRVQWSEVSELFCDDCSSSACAPNWWSATQREYDNPPESLFPAEDSPLESPTKQSLERLSTEK
jgi:hypothetical protein